MLIFFLYVWNFRVILLPNWPRSVLLGCQWNMKLIETCCVVQNVKRKEDHNKGSIKYFHTESVYDNHCLFMKTKNINFPLFHTNQQCNSPLTLYITMCNNVIIRIYFKNINQALILYSFMSIFIFDNLYYYMK